MANREPRSANAEQKANRSRCLPREFLKKFCGNPRHLNRFYEASRIYFWRKIVPLAFSGAKESPCVAAMRRAGPTIK
jgi:hypothetical protein